MTTVFTNGCFDVLHIGHVRCLEWARAQGDYLIVGLNSDASVRRLKGESRPVFPEAERREMLKALRCVDEVILFDADTPLELIRRLRPDVLVKGADYAGKPIAGADLVKEVRLCPLVAGRSTSSTLAKM